MTDRLTNIEFLLMLSDDVKAQGDELTVEINSRGAAHARRVLELIGMLEKARALLERERQRFGIYLQHNIERQEFPPAPNQQSPSLPRVVSKGPAARTGE